MSPATTPAEITGKPHWPANPRITSDTAKPELCTQTPNRVSDGVGSGSLSTAANANGASTQISARTLVSKLRHQLAPLDHERAADARRGGRRRIRARRRRGC